ncbi:hypothetical protein WR25_00374 [Diploscapter pachys]|uniref:ZP domain-containing protein n=1 Tax=Diploscapter pachys TaxID=2018661 RepID=A0A2A2JYZ5_9BILA|nr:hypothetical protein WR25_00374 [Diploscapter pachys]
MIFMLSLYFCLVFSVFPPVSRGKQLSAAPNSSCQFSVHREGPDGPIVVDSSLDDELYYKIVCSSQPASCLSVSNCTVSDSSAKSTQSIQIIDVNGCSLDTSLFSHVQYSSHFSAVIHNPFPIRFRNSGSGSVNLDCQTTFEDKDSEGEEFNTVTNVSNLLQTVKMRNSVLLLWMFWLVTAAIDGYFVEEEQQMRHKRQVSIYYIISGALNLVRPIFDTSQPLRAPSTFSDVSKNDMRDSSVLGADEQRSILRKIPLCKGGDSRICQFISCSAENFKKDQTFSNIQLAAQILGDSKLRKAVASNPEAVTSACKEQGMDDSECRVFGSGFQLINNFLGRIEKAEEKHKDEKVTSPLEPQNDAPIDGNGENVDWDYNEVSRRDKPAVNSGSRTWSSNVQPINEIIIPERNDLVSSLTPPPFLLPIFTFPTPTTPLAPPLAFPTVKSIISPFITQKQLLELDAKNGLFSRRMKRDADLHDDIYDETGASDERIKRADYYDQLSDKPKKDEDPGKSFLQMDTASGDDYYDSIDSGKKKSSSNGKSSKSQNGGLKDCISLLGIILMTS